MQKYEMIVDLPVYRQVDWKLQVEGCKLKVLNCLFVYLFICWKLQVTSWNSKFWTCLSCL